MIEENTEAVVLPKWLVEDKIPEWCPPEMEHVYDKELALTCLDESEIKYLDLLFIAAEISQKNSIPVDSYTPELDVFFVALHRKQFAKLRRSRGGFERKLQATQRIEQEIKAIPKLVKKKFSILGKGKEKEEIEEAEE